MQYTFADCLLDTETRTLMRAGTAVPVEPQVFDLLALLASNAERVVTTDEIVQVVWRGRIVSDSTISARIASARKAVGDTGKDQAVIRTVQRHCLQLVAPLSAPKPTEALPRPSAQTVRYATAPDGAKIAFAVSGRADGTPLLMCMYAGTDLEADWTAPVTRPLFDALGTDHKLVRYDLRGSGLSERTLDRVNYTRNIMDMIAVADAAGLDQFAVLGESGGCLDAIHLAASHPERIKHLILAGGYTEGRSVREGGPPTEAESIRAIINEGWGKPNNAFATAFATTYFPEGPYENVRLIAENMTKSIPLENMLIYRDGVNLASVVARLPQIDAPTLIIHGRHDSVHPLSEARKLAQGIRDAEMVVLETANHVPLPGHPTFQSYLDAILGFLARA